MLQIEIDAGDLELGRTSDELLQDSLYEFTKTEPKTVEDMLAEESQVLDTVFEKVNTIHENVGALADTVNSRFDAIEQQMSDIQAFLSANGNNNRN